MTRRPARPPTWCSSPRARPAGRSRSSPATTTCSAGSRAVFTAAGGPAFAHQADLTAEDEVADLAEAGMARFGRTDALHNNASAIHRDATPDLLSTSLESWEWTLRTCLTSQFLCCR